MPLRLPKDDVLYISEANDKRVVLSTHAGVSISRAALSAIDIQTNNPTLAVSFIFNDTEVGLQPGDTAADVERRWDQKHTKEYDEWAASPEGKAELARQDEDARQYAHKVAEGERKTREIVSRSRSDSRMTWRQ